MENNLGNKQTMAKNIRYQMSINGMSRRALSECVGSPYTTVCDWLNAKTYPRIDKIEKMAQLFGISKADLVEEKPLVRIMESIEKVLSKIPLYENVVSAGGGAWLADGHEYTYLYLEDVPENADFALRVRGDSMEPMYYDDDIVFVRANALVEGGQIGVFCLNGEGYLKMLQGNKLVSLHDNYKPIVMNEWDSYFVAGRVVGKTRIDYY